MFIPLLNQKYNDIAVYQPILSLLRIFLDINFDIRNLNAKAYFTFISEVEEKGKA